MINSHMCEIPFKKCAVQGETKNSLSDWLRASFGEAKTPASGAAPEARTFSLASDSGFKKKIVTSSVTSPSQIGS